MYRLQVLFGKEWTWGVVTYPSLEEAESRIQKLKQVGIKARIRRNMELFS